MFSSQQIRDRLRRATEQLKVNLSGEDGGLSLALFGGLVGLLTGVVIILFRLTIEGSQSRFLPGGGTENYEELGAWARLLLGGVGGLAIGLLLHALASSRDRLGVVHVMERLAYHEGHLPLRNAVAQFLGASLAIITGQSVGREGPGIHLGAASGSLLGVHLRLPNNAVRNLTACGIAASIAASFNTPLAGVIFAMEVVMIEYTIHGYIPVIAATVGATALTRLVYGSEPAFSIPPLQLGSLGELHMMVLLGLLIGTLAALFTNSLLYFTSSLKSWPVWQRTTLAGLLLGLLSTLVPEIMGIGYDTVNAALIGEIGLAALLLITAAKLLATTAGLGLGIPGGLIGPTLMLGATAGGALGVAVGQWLPGDASTPAGFYALLGMGAMMAATLQAPLAAIAAILELSSNPNIIMPGLLVLITANLTYRYIHSTESVFLLQIRAFGLDYHNSPITQSLRRQCVTTAMERSFVVLPQMVRIERAHESLVEQPVWVIIEDKTGPVAVLEASDIAMNLEEIPAHKIENGGKKVAEQELDLMQIPGKRFDLVPIAQEATLQEAMNQLGKTGVEALYVTRNTTPGITRVCGILTREDLERSYSN